VCVLLPLIKDPVPFHGAAYGIQHIAVALAVHRLLEPLYGQAQVYLIGRYVLADAGQVGCLYGIQEHKETEYFIKCLPLCPGQVPVILHIRAKVDFFRYPEIIHGLSVPGAGPGVLHIVKVVEIGGIAPNHPPAVLIRVPLWVKQGFCL